MSLTNEDFFRVTGLTFSWPGGATLFRDADFRCGMTERLGIAADNGTGKSTFLRLLTGLETPAAGEIRSMGDPARTKEDFRRVRTHAGFVLQNPDDQLFFPEVIDDVMFGPMNLGLTESEARARAEEVLTRLSIAHLAHADSFSLSGGQKRLVTVASVLSMHPTGLLLDEPSTGLDRAARERLTEVLLAFPGPEIIVSHDEGFLAGLCTRVVTIENGTFRTL